jgi:probable F420-dependent oxidoreductase
MDFGVFLPVSGAASTRDGLKHAAATAERLGFSTVWAADRIVIPWRIETPYGYSWSDKFIVPPEKPFLESMTALAFLAGATDKIRLGVSVLVAPYRDPVHWAKVAATIDHLSEGRFILGVGIGWMEEEFAALGRSELFARRGRIADEQLEIARNLFTEDHCSHQGEHYSYDDIAFYPKGAVPIWCGGESRPAQRRAGRYGDAWFPYFARITPEELRVRYAYVSEVAAGTQRDVAAGTEREVGLNCCLSVEVTDGPVEQEPDRLRGSVEQVADAIARFEQVGVKHLALQFIVGRYPERLEQMERLMPALTAG